MKEPTMNQSTLTKESSSSVFAIYRGCLVEVKLQTTWGEAIIKTSQGLVYVNAAELQIIQEY